VARVRGDALHGAAASLELGYGLTDSIGLLGALRYEGLAQDGPLGPEPFSRAGAAVGVSYVFDVLQIVPWGSITVGALALGGGSIAWRWRAEARLAVGLDWLVRRSFSAGLEVGLSLVAPDLRLFPWALTATLRFSYRKP
jgi:hypothetical protein